MIATHDILTWKCGYLGGGGFASLLFYAFGFVRVSVRPSNPFIVNSISQKRFQGIASKFPNGFLAISIRMNMLVMTTFQTNVYQDNED